MHAQRNLVLPSFFSNHYPVVSPRRLLAGEVTDPMYIEDPSPAEVPDHLLRSEVRAEVRGHVPLSQETYRGRMPRSRVMYLCQRWYSEVMGSRTEVLMVGLLVALDVEQ